MNINQLQTFLILSDCLNVTETAQKTHCSQPAVSTKIRILEEQLGTPLFDRIHKRMYLTPQGTAFRQYVQQIINTLSAAKEHLHQMDDPTQGTIHFGASNFIGVYLIPKIMAFYKKMMPKTAFEMDITDSTQLIRKLENNKLEFLIMSDQIEFDPKRFVFIDLYRDNLVLVAAPDHPFAKRKHCHIDDIRNEPFLIKPEPSATHSFLRNQLLELGGSIDTPMYISSLEGIKQAVMHNVGISIVSRLSVAHEIKSKALVEIPIKNITLERGIRIIHHKDKYLSPVTAKFFETLRSGHIKSLHQ